VADAVQRVPGTQVNVVDGDRGEFVVRVDGKEVPRTGNDPPSVEQVLAAVGGRAAAPAG